MDIRLNPSPCHVNMVYKWPLADMKSLISIYSRVTRIFKFFKPSSCPISPLNSEPGKMYHRTS